MLPTYGSFRPKPPNSFTVTAISGTANSATYNVRIAFVNRAGLSLLCDPVSVTGTGLEIVLNDGLVLDTEEVFWVCVAVETTGNIEDSGIIALWQARDAGQQAKRSLPITLNFTTPEHLNTARQVLTTEDLPTTGMVAGAIAKVASTGNYYRYDPEAFVDSNGSLKSYNAIAEGVGQWVRWYGSNSAYVAGIAEARGSDRIISTVNKALKVPLKIEGNDSVPLRYFLNNGLVADGQSPLINQKLTFRVSVNGQSGYEAALNNKIKYTLVHYQDRETAIADTTVIDAGVEKTWNTDNPICLASELPRNHAAALDVVLSWDIDAQLGILPGLTPEIEIDIVRVLPVKGVVSELAKFVGDLVLGNDDQLLIVPGLKRLKGKASIGAGFIVEDDNEQMIPVPEADTADQKVWLAGSLNGLTTVRNSTSTADFGEVLRAIVSTEPGDSKLVEGTPITLNSEGITITVTHPLLVNGAGIVRSDYPDNLIAGNMKAMFTPSSGYVVLDVDGEIYKSPIQSVAAIALQQFTFSNLDNFTVEATLLDQADPEFSLFEAVSVEAIAATGTITGAVIKPYFQYAYPSPNVKATKISHAGTGVIDTSNSTLAEVIAGALTRNNNLSDVENPSTALSNLGGVAQTLFDDLSDRVMNIYSTIMDYGNVITRDVGTAIGDVIELVDIGSGAAGLPPVDGSQLTGLDTSNQDDAIQALQVKTTAVTLVPKTLVLGDFPYTLKIEDYGKELILDAVTTGTLFIPDDITSFDDNFVTILSNDGGSNVLIEREDGQQTDILFTNNKQRSQSVGTIAIRRRQGTNIVKVDGNLE